MVSLPLTKLIHENMATILTYSFSQEALSNLNNKNYKGKWKYIEKMFFEIPRLNADRAAIELALLIRMLDDHDQISTYLSERSSALNYVGFLKEKNTKVDKRLTVRQCSNKIIHARELKWDFSRSNSPKLNCYPQKGQDWEVANIDIISWSTYCGALTS